MGNDLIACIVDYSTDSNGNLVIFEIQQAFASLINKSNVSLPRTNILQNIFGKNLNFHGKFGIEGVRIQSNDPNAISIFMKYMPKAARSGLSLDEYKFKFVPTQEQAYNFDHKVYSRLYLNKHCPEVCPEFKVYSSSSDIETTIRDIQQNFIGKKIVVKASRGYNGWSNVFIDLSKEGDSETLHKAINIMSKQKSSNSSNYDFLVEEQVHYEKPDKDPLKGLAVYRGIIFYSPEELFKFAITRKCISQSVDSHECHKVKEYY